MYDCTNSIYGPLEYTLMSKKQSQKFLDDHNFKPNQLPSYCCDGPIVKYYDAEIGQIFEVKRQNVLDSMLLDEDYFYRIVSSKSIDKKN